MEHDELRELQDELNRLRGELRSQWARTEALQKRIAELTGQPEAEKQVRKTEPAAFSFENFLGLRLIQFIGIIVLVIGLSIGVKYAIDRNLISEALRIGLAYAAGLVLYLLSLRLRKKYELFSALLYSGGMASLYFTTYAANVYYNMLSFPVSFLIMIALTVYTAYEAMRYNRQEIGLLGLVGAYGIPFLISRNQERADLFFLYISLINGGVIFLCVRQLWKYVGRVANLLTWLLFLGWAASRFHPGQEGIGAFFLIFFFLMFFFVSICYKLMRKQPLTPNETTQMTINNIALYLGALFLFGGPGMTANLAAITFSLAAFAALQSWLIYSVWKEEVVAARIVACFSLVLFVLFIYFNWSGFMVTVLWLVTAVVVFLWGFARQSATARLMGLLLTGATLLKLVLMDSISFTTIQKVIAYLAVGILLLVASFLYQRRAGSNK